MITINTITINTIIIIITFTFTITIIIIIRFRYAGEGQSPTRSRVPAAIGPAEEMARRRIKTAPHHLFDAAQGRNKRDGTQCRLG